MQIVIIGTGNTATVLGKKLLAAGHDIVQVYGRSQAAATELAEQLNAQSCSAWDAIYQQAALYIVAIADKALAGGEVHLQLTDQLVVHTAGAVSMEVLKNISPNYGVLYPLQTIRKEVDPMPDIPLLIDGSTIAAKETIAALAKTIAQKVSYSNDAARIQYHLCAVMTNNFSNYLYTLTEEYCKKNGLHFSHLLPLIDETARRLHRFSPRNIQTGPAIRKDVGTIEQHLGLLENDPALKKMYRFFSDQMMDFDWKKTGN